MPGKPRLLPAHLRHRLLSIAPPSGAQTPRLAVADYPACPRRFARIREGNGSRRAHRRHMASGWSASWESPRRRCHRPCRASWECHRPCRASYRCHHPWPGIISVSILEEPPPPPQPDNTKVKTITNKSVVKEQEVFLRNCLGDWVIFFLLENKRDWPLKRRHR